MYKIGEVLKVPVLIIKHDTGAERGYAFGVVLGESKTVEDATELRVELEDERFTVANIKNSDLQELNG